MHVVVDSSIRGEIDGRSLSTSLSRSDPSSFSVGRRPGHPRAVEEVEPKRRRVLDRAPWISKRRKEKRETHADELGAVLPLIIPPHLVVDDGPLPSIRRRRSDVVRLPRVPSSGSVEELPGHPHVAGIQLPLPQYRFEHASVDATDAIIVRRIRR